MLTTTWVRVTPGRRGIRWASPPEHGFALGSFRGCSWERDVESARLERSTYVSREAGQYSHDGGLWIERTNGGAAEKALAQGVNLGGYPEYRWRSQSWRLVEDSGGSWRQISDNADGFWKRQRAPDTAKKDFPGIKLCDSITFLHTRRTILFDAFQSRLPPRS